MRVVRAEFRLMSTVVGGIFLGACGSNNASVPQALLDAINGQTAPASGYPAGPYGTQVGDTVKNLCFNGWQDPSTADFDPTKFQQICLSNFYNPSGDTPAAGDAGTSGAKLLLVNSSALWCTACRYEYGGSGDRPPLSSRLAQRQAEGFRILGTLFQNLAGAAADANDAKAWTENYDIDFPFALDDTFQMGIFASSSLAPFNMLVDTKTMKIVLEISGDEDAVLFGQVDTFLGTSTQ
ncbi:MAG TPA: hypothetical protein VH142_18925 [Polyangiaceae bacterium]|jgi:hypothetical protein|nr:hypothetical protein [Polyangiaceae bacterium]